MILCILIPLLVGLLCALLGYLLGRYLAGIKHAKEIEVWSDKTARLEASLADAKSRLAECKTNLDNCTSTLAITKSRLIDAERAAAESNAIVAPDVTPSAPEAAATIMAFDSSAAKAVFGKNIKQDDLTVVEGIGPKIQELFHNHGIHTWKALGEATVSRCQEILNAGGERYKVHNPGTWPRQAMMAYEGKWQELLDWQDILDHGKE